MKLDWTLCLAMGGVGWNGMGWDRMGWDGDGMGTLQGVLPPLTNLAKLQDCAPNELHGCEIDDSDEECHRPGEGVVAGRNNLRAGLRSEPEHPVRCCGGILSDHQASAGGPSPRASLASCARRSPACQPVRPVCGLCCVRAEQLQSTRVLQAKGFPVADLRSPCQPSLPSRQ